MLDGVDFGVRSGEFVSVLGPSGCGKSTLLNLAAGFLEPDSGLVEVDGEKVTGPDARRGVVFQQYAIFPWLTVEKNIAFGLTLRSNRRPKAEIREVVARYVDLMGLNGFEKALPKTLSGGMRQRVALARAYATDPDVMLLDEPFAALDAQTREFMQELLHEASQRDRRAAMLITHSVEEAIFLSQRIVVLTNRPTHVHEVVDVDVEWPRTPESRTAPAFIELRKHLEGVMRSMTTLPPAPQSTNERRNHHDHRCDDSSGRSSWPCSPWPWPPAAPSTRAVSDKEGVAKAKEGATEVKVGYLHTIAVDDKLWLGQAEGQWADAGLDLKTTAFDTGIELSQALTGGSIDVAIMGGVTSNFPAQGQGKIFMLNSRETATARLFVQGDSGISSVADLKGKKVITTEGTTADIYLHRALREGRPHP